jgi:TMEM199 family protein
LLTLFILIPQSPEYLALKASLLAAQEQSAYDFMLSQKPVSLLSPQSPSDTDADDISVSLVLNILLSILLCGFAVSWATRYWESMPARIGLSFAAGIVVGVAEVGVYAGYLRRVELSGKEEKRRSKREVKRVIEGKSWSTEVRKVDGGERKGTGNMRSRQKRAEHVGKD